MILIVKYSFPFGKAKGNFTYIKRIILEGLTDFENN